MINFRRNNLISFFLIHFRIENIQDYVLHFILKEIVFFILIQLYLEDRRPLRAGRCKFNSKSRLVQYYFKEVNIRAEWFILGLLSIRSTHASTTFQFNQAIVSKIIYGKRLGNQSREY